MTLFQAIVLGIVQGLTEFLPISSTAHLRIVPALLGWKDPGAAFSAVIQCGTLAAVIGYFRRDILQILRAWFVELRRGPWAASHDARLGWMIIVGTVPLIVGGALLKKQISGGLRSLYVISGALIAVGLILVLAEWLAAARARHKSDRPLEQVGWKDAITVGMAQALALIPGASRSGTTIAAGLFTGLSREAAARFSFLLSLPAVFAAAVHQLLDERQALLASRDDALNLAGATIAAGVVGYAAIAFLLAYLKRHSTLVFVVYRILLAGLLLTLLASGKLNPLAGTPAAKAPLSKPADEL